MSVDDNDIRATIGAVHNAVKGLREDVEGLRESLDDIGAMAARAARLAEVVDLAESLMDELPALIRRLADDPALGMMMGPTIYGLADDVERSIAERRARRAGPPAVERA